MKLFYSILGLLLFSNILFSQTQISIDSVSSHIGQHIKICDKVADTFRAAEQSSITYLNFGGKYPNHKFTVVIFAKDLVNFPFSPIETYKNQNVCVEGMAAEYKVKPQIVAKFPDQIEIKQNLKYDLFPRLNWQTILIIAPNPSILRHTSLLHSLRLLHFTMFPLRCTTFIHAFREPWCTVNVGSYMICKVFLSRSRQKTQSNRLVRRGFLTQRYIKRTTNHE